MRGAPKPTNFQAMSDAWQDPRAFARELNAYYEQLRADDAPQHWTERNDR